VPSRPGSDPAAAVTTVLEQIDIVHRMVALSGQARAGADGGRHRRAQQGENRVA
jgi:hypothetical protein